MAFEFSRAEIENVDRVYVILEPNLFHNYFSSKSYFFFYFK